MQSSTTELSVPLPESSRKQLHCTWCDAFVLQVRELQVNFE
jgi:hypothetical protein